MGELADATRAGPCPGGQRGTDRAGTRSRAQRGRASLREESLNLDIIKLSGVPPWDGRYEFNLKAQPLSTHEWGWIKRLSGWMPLTIEEGYDGGDPELYATFAAIALCRAKKIEPGSVTAVY